MLADKTAYDDSYAESPSRNSDASFPTTPESNENSSSGSFKTFSVYDGKGSTTPSSTIYEEIAIGPSVLLPYDDAEEQFLEDYESYFLHLSVDNVRKDQYPDLELQRIVYLDYATCPLYSRFQVKQHMKFLLEESDSEFGSDFPIDKQSAVHNPYIDSTYQHILNLLNTTRDDYSIIFAPGLSSCYRLFGEMYDLQKGSLLLASNDHHKSVQHLVDVATRSNVKVGSIPLKSKDWRIHGDDMYRLLRKQGRSGNGCGLLVYPAQSFLTGICHSLNWIPTAQQNGWKVLLDVSSCLPMVNVDLSLYQPEFVVGSLHHMIGYPSDVGFLLVRSSSHSICAQKTLNELKLTDRPGNGNTVHVITDGNRVNIHTFAALRFGLDHLEDIGIMAIQRRVQSLTAWLVKTLNSLKHKLDSKPLLQLYGTLDPKQRGSILAFNVVDSTGNIFAPRLVRQLAERSNIFLDTGSLCNINMLHLVQSKSHKQVDSSSASSSQRDIQVLRLSLGPVTTFDDAYRLVQFLARFRDEDYMSSEAAGYVQELENV